MIPYALIATFVRYALLALAGHLATRGYFDETLVDSIVSAGVAASAIVWFLVTKRKPDDKDSLTTDDPDYSGHA